MPVFFVRDEPAYKRNEEKIWRELSEASKRLRIVFAYVDGREKPKPVYLGQWGFV